MDFQDYDDARDGCPTLWILDQVQHDEVSTNLMSALPDGSSCFAFPGAPFTVVDIERMLVCIRKID